MIIETVDLRLLLKLVEDINLGMDYSRFTNILKRNEKRANRLTDNIDNINGHIDQKILSHREVRKSENEVNNGRNKPENEENELKDGKKSDEQKKDKDIVVIIDESKKHKDELDEQIESITLKMDGFERIHLEQYQKQLDEYKRFLAEYLRDANNAASSPYSNYDNNEGDKQRKFEWGQEVVTYGEIKDIVRRIQMNALLGAGSNGDLSGHNQVSWQEAQDYKFWKYCSKFNEQMSFVIHDLVGSGG
ncbi:hypothetical protein HY636_00215 [Candidatus Woesearchaeota archaeon]|nr:hypothetical protein [Candidatus Woesearchaeota archaeon]